MRLLHRLEGRVPVWPFDPRPGLGQPGGRNLHPLVYPPRRAQRPQGAQPGRARSSARPRSAAGLPVCTREPNDHETDVLIAAAGLRAIAGDERYWNPAGLTPAIARTEGWTFGML